MRRTGILLLILLLLFPYLAAFSEAADEPLMTVGTSSEDVRAVKKRLRELGYYQGSSFTKKYTEDTAEKIRAFQRINGLPETGAVTARDWQLLFSEDAIASPKPTPKPFATPAPTPQVQWPSRDAEGYLAEEGEFVYENDEDGLWVYLSPSLQISIVRREDSTVPLIWFETDIRMRGDECIHTAEVNPARPGTKLRYPADIARDEGFVLGFSDDFYADRVSSGTTKGVVIRQGKILFDSAYSGRNHHFPNLDMLVQYGDGSLKAMVCGSRTAAELLAEGAVNVFAFGPVMITNGAVSDELTSGYYSSHEPRQCFGMIEPGHYFLVSVQGRMDASQGTDLAHVAAIMLEHGVTEALNLDGGNTMALVFRGRMLNKLATWNNKKFVRTVSSLIGIGYTENMAE